MEEAKLGVLEAESLVKVDVGTGGRKMQAARAMLGVAELAHKTTAEKLRVALEQFKQQATLQRQVLQAHAPGSGDSEHYHHAPPGDGAARPHVPQGQGAPD